MLKSFIFPGVPRKTIQSLHRTTRTEVSHTKPTRFDSPTGCYRWPGATSLRRRSLQREQRSLTEMNQQV